MQETFEINVLARSDGGKGASRRLRRKGLVPGIVYGAGEAPEMVAADHNELIRHLANEAFYSHVLKVKIDGKAQNVVLKDLQRHPAKPFISHFDLLRVRMDEKIRMAISLHLEGEDVCLGVKAGGTLLRGINDVEIECLPNDLPEFISVNVSALEIGDMVHLSQLEIPAGVTMVGADQLDEDNDPMVVTVEMVRVAVAEEEEGVTEEPQEPAAQPDGKEGEEPGSES